MRISLFTGGSRWWSRPGVSNPVSESTVGAVGRVNYGHGSKDYPGPRQAVMAASQRLDSEEQSAIPGAQPDDGCALPGRPEDSHRAGGAKAHPLSRFVKHAFGPGRCRSSTAQCCMSRMKGTSLSPVHRVVMHDHERLVVADIRDRFPQQIRQVEAFHFPVTRQILTTAVNRAVRADDAGQPMPMNGASFSSSFRALDEIHEHLDSGVSLRPRGPGCPRCVSITRNVRRRSERSGFFSRFNSTIPPGCCFADVDGKDAVVTARIQEGRSCTLPTRPA